MSDATHVGGPSPEPGEKPLPLKPGGGDGGPRAPTTYFRLDTGPRQFGNYTLLKELGRGAQGVVYLAEDSSLRRKVALKMLTRAGAQSKNVRDRFRREAELTSKFEHPGICGVHDFGEVDGMPYIAMQYVRGTTLASIVEKARKGSGGGDYVVSQQGKLVHVEYTTIAGAHCGFHFDSVDKFEIDHVTDDTNSYGTMLYGSGAGPNTISYSNFTNGTKDLDAQGTNGPIKVDHVHTSGKDSFSGVVPTITNKEANPVPNAKPR